VAVGRRKDRRGEILGLLALQTGVALANARISDGLRTNLDRLSRLGRAGSFLTHP
jgi:hypothetical protein